MTHTEHTSASPRTALAPDTRLLDPRAARAWTEEMAVSALGGGIYEVDSSSDNRYVVDLVESRCSCPDHQFRGERCKHIRRVALEITGGRLPAPGFRAVECLRCGREAFVRESAPAVCERCYLPPGTTVRDRETGTVVVVVETTDERCDEVTVATTRTLADFADADGDDEGESEPGTRPGSGAHRRPGEGDRGASVTVADYPRNDHYPRSDPVVRAVYPFSGDADTPFEDLRRYSFPRSRLERVLAGSDEAVDQSDGRPALPAE